MDSVVSTTSMYAEAAALCMSKGVAFAVFSIPGSDELRFFSNPKLRHSHYSEEVFTITPWGGDRASTIEIRNELNLQNTLTEVVRLDNIERADVTLQPSTMRDDYIEGVSDLIVRLRQTKGKTVISRIKDLPVGLTPYEFSEIAVDAMRNNIPAFGFLFYTPATGCWAGLTPEKLLEADFEDGTFSTVALAGTRSSSDRKIWDEKNLSEHGFVVDHIRSVLDGLGLEYDQGRTETLNAGAIEHLQTPFSGSMGNCRWQDIVGALHPTPAIAGYPLRDALSDISSIERHDRRCYGGYVSYRNRTRMIANLTLRCVEYVSGQVCLYAGGGITGASDAADEWIETELKMSVFGSRFDRLPLV